jgi:hypothetical protein
MQYHRVSMTRERYQTRLDEDVAREVDAYVARNDISQSEGMRRLVREGLESVNSEDLSDKIESDHNQILDQIHEIQPDEPELAPTNDKSSSSDNRSMLLRKQFDSTNNIDTNSIDTRVRIIGGSLITILIIAIFILQLITFI